MAHLARMNLLQTTVRMASSVPLHGMANATSILAVSIAIVRSGSFDIGLIISLLIAVGGFVLLPIWSSCTQKIPNAHPLAPYTQLWILYCRWCGEEIHVVRQAHERLGPVVRLGPQEVSILEGAQEIYYARLEKTSWYEVFSNSR